MKLNFNLFILTGFITSNIYAVVPIVNAVDPSYNVKYSGQIASYAEYLNKMKTSYDQLNALKGLEQIHQGGQTLCNLCSPQELKDLQFTIGELNGGLCQSFTQVFDKITNTKETFDSINQIQSAFQSNPAEASVALQQASYRLQQANQQTFLQMQAVQAQKMQKDLVEEKVQNQARNDIWKGMSNQ